MRGVAMVLGVILIVLGILALTMGGIPYLFETNVTRTNTTTSISRDMEAIPLTPEFGVIALIGGIALVGISAASSPRSYR
jgi:uncharacterized membrane protein HdeD (DUF308 family)